MSVAGSTPSTRWSTPRVTLGIILVSETVFFGTLLAAYAALRLENGLHVSRDLARLLLPITNTVVLLASTLPARWSARASSASRRIFYLALTLALGTLFVGGQVLEFTRNGMRVDDAGTGGVFFALMGFHALHIAAGMLVFGINLARVRLGDFATSHSEVLLVGSWFWYYVVAVWLALFAALYLT